MIDRLHRWGFSVIALIAAAMLSASCSRAPRDFGDLRLDTVGTSQSVALAECPTSKCLTVYVAPWCPYCRASGGLIRALRDRLRTEHVAMRVVVGMDKPDEVRSYAQQFGPDTLLDGPGRMHVSGVPHFFASDAHGRIIKEISGAPMLPEPWSPEILDKLGSELGVL